MQETSYEKPVIEGCGGVGGAIPAKVLARGRTILPRTNHNYSIDSKYVGFVLSLLYLSINRASVKRTYDVYYALRLPPDVQIELQRRTADFRNFFCPSEIDTRDVQKLSKGPPTFNQLYDVCPTYLTEILYLC